MRIYVGNLPYDLTDEELRQQFAAYGEVTSANVMTDRLSGRPKGFGFVEMASKSESVAAISALNGKTLKERTIVVNEARPRSDGRSSGSYGDWGGRGHSGSRGGRSGRGRRRRY